MTPAAPDGPYRAPLVVDAPFAPSLRFVRLIAALFALPASLYLLGSVWSLFSAPECQNTGALRGEALMLLVIGVGTGAFGIAGTRRVTAAVRDRVRVRTWLGKTAWTTIAVAPAIFASLCVLVTAFYFDMHYLFLRCLDLGGVFSFH